MTKGVASRRTPRTGPARAAAVLASLATAAVVHGGETLTLHVDDDAAPGGNGSSWARPLRDLQLAITLARHAAATNPALERVDILIAQGLYKPDDGTGDRTRSFWLDDGLLGADMASGVVALRGGFGGVTATDPGERDVDLYRTILSGDLNGDDQPGFVNIGDNSRRVVGAGMATTSTMTAIFEGLTIRGGGGPVPYSAGGGLGVFNINCHVRNCTVEGNYSNYGGAGMFLAHADVRLESCVVRNNRADGPGGGIFVDGSVWNICEIVDTVISDNEAIFGGGLAANSFVSVEGCEIAGNMAALGGGVHLGEDWRPWRIHRIERSRITHNWAWVDGGGIFAAAALTCANTLIAFNNAGDLGGGVYALSAAPEFYSVTIVRNDARRGRGVMLDETEGTAVIEGCIVWGDSPQVPGEIFLRSIAADAAPAFRYSTLSGGLAGVERVEAPPPDFTGSIDADPLFRDPLGLDADPDNDFALRAGSPAIDSGSDPHKRPLDFLGNSRALDVPGAPNVVDPNWPVDMGAIEYIPCPCDADGDGAVAVFDLLLYLDWWFAGDARAEMNGELPVDVFDLLVFLDCWFTPASFSPCQ